MITHSKSVIYADNETYLTIIKFLFIRKYD